MLTPTLARSLDWLALAVRVLPRGRRAWRAVLCSRNVRYRPQLAGEGPSCGLMDVWRPRAAKSPRPLVVYVHGGGFAFCSKETHALVAAELAGHDFVVANINYRRVPHHPVPAALADVAQAIAYCTVNARILGACPDTLVLMGESAGANLVLAQVLALALPAACAPAWAQPLHAAKVRVRAVLPACGLLDIEAPERFRAVTPLPSAYAQARIAAVCAGYAPKDTNPEGAWASPLRLLERSPEKFTALPPTWISVGEADPILDDSLRLERALQAAGVDCSLARFEGRGHAFFAIPQRPDEDAFWRQAASFIRRVLGRDAAEGVRGAGEG